jgi:RNA polymerase sigma-70 factor (ECF subfamily)
MNETEFEQAFRDYFTLLTNIAFSVVKEEDTAKDIVQQVFLKLWHKKETLEIRNQLKSYLHRAVINTSINFLERNKKIKLEADISSLEIHQSYIEPDDSRTANIEMSVKTAIDSLPEKCRLVFSLSRFSEMRNKDIAQSLGISVKAVEKHIGRALKELRIKLEPVYKTFASILFFLFFR